MFIDAPRLIIRFGLGLVVSTLIGIVAYRRGSLSQSGIFGAILTGTAIFGFGGWAAGLTLIAFFVSSSVLSHFRERDTRKQRAAEMFDKGGQRDLWQALANGGAAAAFAAIAGLSDAQSTLALAAVAAMVGALATVNADTWATELGVLNKAKPRLITTFGIVEPGTSGGVSPVGIGAALMGAAFIAVVYFILRAIEFGGTPTPPGVMPGAAAIIIGGVAGSLFDSFLGATVQAMYYSHKRNKETEKQFERDGTPNKPIRGWPWLNNDWVNFISSVFGALVSAAIALLVIKP